MRLVLALPALLLAACADPGPAPPSPSLPFGSHAIGYTANSILPSVPVAERDDATAAFYEAWKERYLFSGCGNERYYVKVDPTRSALAPLDPATLTISPAHGYAMLITALMAGRDPDARRWFDGLYAFYKDHSSAQSPALMAFNPLQDCSSAQGNGGDSATDGDLDIAYSLLLADRQWGSSGSINYRYAAQQLIAAIAAREIAPAGGYVMLGDFVHEADPKYFHGSRPSDFVIDHFRSFSTMDSNDTVWSPVLDASYRLIDAVQSSASPLAGLLPDFIEDADGSSPHPATDGFMETAHDGAYWLNACRIPWRLATDYLVSGEPRALTALTKMNDWARQSSAGDPKNVSAGYGLDGLPLAGPLHPSMAFSAPLAVAALVDPQNGAWVDANWSYVVNGSIDDDDWYGNTIKLLSMIVMSGNWWSP